MHAQGSRAHAEPCTCNGNLWMAPSSPLGKRCSRPCVMRKWDPEKLRCFCSGHTARRFDSNSTLFVLGPCLVNTNWPTGDGEDSASQCKEWGASRVLETQFLSLIGCLALSGSRSRSLHWDAQGRKGTHLLDTGHVLCSVRHWKMHGGVPLSESF